MAHKNFNNNDTPPAAGERPAASDTTRRPDDTQPGSSVNAGDPAAGGIAVILRHKSPYPRYRRAGLLLTARWEPYTVTAEQRAALQADAWVEFQKPAGADTK